MGCLGTTGIALMQLAAVLVVVYWLVPMTCSRQDGPALYTTSEAESLQASCTVAVNAIDPSAPRCRQIDDVERRCLEASRAISRISDSGMNRERRSILQSLKSDARRQLSIVRRLKEVPCL